MRSNISAKEITGIEPTPYNLDTQYQFSRVRYSCHAVTVIEGARWFEESSEHVLACQFPHKRGNVTLADNVATAPLRPALSGLIDSDEELLKSKLATELLHRAGGLSVPSTQDYSR